MNTDLKEEREMTDKDNETVTFKKITIWQTTTFVLLGLLIVSLFTGGFGLNGEATVTGNAVAPVPTAQGKAPTPAANGNIQVSVSKDDPVLGNKNAKIKMVEFSDFECPFCARAFEGALKEFRQSKYFKDGIVSLTYKHLPLDINCNPSMQKQLHQNACKSAEASVCASEQGKFWEYHDLLFANQDALDETSLKSYATQIGLNAGTFADCLVSGNGKAKVSADIAEGSKAGARGTPYFVLINEKGQSQVVSGAAPWANFEAAIQALL